jgi:hypothetical protein
MKSKNAATMETEMTNNVPVRPKLVKAAEFAARRNAAVQAEREREQRLAQARQSVRRAPRGEFEARQMFDALFEAA